MTSETAELAKISNMVMCGDHSSFTKAELNLKDIALDEDKSNVSNKRLSGVASQMSKSERLVDSVRSPRIRSEEALRALESRRKPKTGDSLRDDNSQVPANKALLHAALGSFRWPPYLLAVWVLLLLLTHALHCVLSVLSGTLPHIKKFCLYFRAWTETAWKQEQLSNTKFFPILLACSTGVLYTVYFSMYAIFSIVLWSIEPLNSEALTEEVPSEEKAKVIHYLDEIKSSKTCVKL